MIPTQDALRRATRLLAASPVRLYVGVSRDTAQTLCVAAEATRLRQTLPRRVIEVAATDTPESLAARVDAAWAQLQTEIASLTATSRPKPKRSHHWRTFGDYATRGK